MAAAQAHESTNQDTVGVLTSRSHCYTAMCWLKLEHHDAILTLPLHGDAPIPFLRQNLPLNIHQLGEGGEGTAVHGSSAQRDMPCSDIP